jgi:phosphoribosylaminoimidazole-succinocarboxamide synthase
MIAQTLYESSIASLPLLHRGKVRDIYAVGNEHLLIVTSDRLSAFDVVLPDPIPGKGAVLTRMSNFWFERFEAAIANHLTDLRLEDVLPDRHERAQAEGRSVVVRKLRPIPIEAVARGYLIGSGWKDYQRSGTVCGIALPPGLELAAQLPQALFTPSTKAAQGSHDENISFEHVAAAVGKDLATQLRDMTLRIYTEAAQYARTKGIVIADTKLEFGLDQNGSLVLMDEVLTPDSSRFWPADSYRVGISPPSYDKQFVRDYLETLKWNKHPPGPRLPTEVIEKTAAKYRQALERLTGNAEI